MNIRNISEFENIPITAPVISALYPNIKAVNKKVSDMERRGDIIRLKNGLYVVNPNVSGSKLCTELIANRLYSPSYISLHTALRLYGLIPEAVYSMQSMTTKHSRTFDNATGHYIYTHTSRQSFHVGLTRRVSGNAAYIIATPEKALCDLIVTTAGVHLRYKNDAIQFLEEDLRMDMDAFMHFNRSIFEEYILVGKKAGSIATLLKILR